MKKLIVIIAAIVFPWIIQAQTKGEEIHNKYSNFDGFNSFSFAGSFLKNLDFDIDEDELQKNITGDCKNIRFISYKHKIDDESKFKNLVKDLLSKGNSYKEVLTEIDKDSDECSDELYFFAKRNGKKHFSEFHILHYNENRTSLVSFFGKFHVDELETLSHFSFDDEE